jgi:hypothetical protein
MTTERPAPSAAGAPASAPSPDRPPVPRSRLSTGAIALAVFGAIGVATYGGIAYADYEFGSPARDEIPASVRSSPGGYRSFHFWHAGYHGGK